ncbi:MAG: peptidase M20 [Alphaproteobacteria bacterium]|jgi:amidohydrolase|nr:peptidase M20 [Alphaproteobacteria bacterium]PPR14548.1 MAG: N-acyl-L-amino acid amidohydrolase [Alphaproteobacteria bacterium MarineAlpha12_Bin1]|tara:strand:- start:4652 stop:5839 length:1188 start_codon:yes stop_codon:yes gene_type:complete
MPVKPEINKEKALMTAWRRHLHANPEIAFKEQETSQFVLNKLEGLGLEVHSGLAGTGVVGRLKAGKGNRAIALRADMDALPLTEKNDFEHCSKNTGMMHACGHDGHTAMLLGAAKYLSESLNFDGVVYFIFQPAEEGEGGGKVMIEEGLFEKFPVESVFGLHNWPGMEVGKFGISSGPMMAAFDIFDLKVVGKGSHGAMPHQGIDPIVAASQIITAVQTITSRNTDPLDALVVSITQIHGGDAYNVIPESVELKGTVRSFKDRVRDDAEFAIRRVCEGICEATGSKFELNYERRYPSTINHEEETQLAVTAASEIVGEKNIDLNPAPSMGSEDFSYMLRERPGCYVWLGNGPAENNCMLHNPEYDFNDDILPIGASYWATLVEQILITESSSHSR